MEMGEIDENECETDRRAVCRSSRWTVEQRSEARNTSFVLPAVCLRARVPCLSARPPVGLLGNVLKLTNTLLCLLSCSLITQSYQASHLIFSSTSSSDRHPHALTSKTHFPHACVCSAYFLSFFLTAPLALCPPSSTASRTLRLAAPRPRCYGTCHYTYTPLLLMSHWGVRAWRSSSVTTIIRECVMFLMVASTRLCVNAQPLYVGLCLRFPQQIIPALLTAGECKAMQ